MRRGGRRLAGNLPVGVTPHEFAAALQCQSARLQARGRLRERLSPAGKDIQPLTDIYAQTVYSSHPPTSADRARAIQSWRRLRWRLWLSGCFTRI